MKSPRGLTLVELTVAMAIAAMLTVAALAAVTNLSRAETEAARRARTLPDVPLRTLLTADLMHATRCESTRAGVSLTTWASIDAATMERRRLPAAVTYAVRKIGPRSWLVRSERSLVMDRRLSELVCDAVAAITVEEVEAKAETKDEAPPAAEDRGKKPGSPRRVARGDPAIPPPSAPAKAEDAPLPAAFAVTVTFEQQDREPLVFTVWRE